MLFISVTVVILLHFVPNRACLDLFPAPPPLAVQSELNLIASLSLLDDFSVGLLPVQVRLCENKLDMIRRVLDATPTSYKKYDKVCVLDSYLMKNFHSPHTTFGLAILNHNLGGMRGVMSQPVVRIITNPEPCITMLLEKLRKSDGSLADCYLYLQHVFKDQVWLLWESRESICAARNSHSHCLIVPSIYSTRISTYVYRGYANSTNLRAVVGLPW